MPAPISKNAHGGSSRTTRNANRANGGAEIAAHAAERIASIAVVPIKFAQTIGSIGMFLREENSMRDRRLHLLQGLLSITQVVLAAMLYIQDENCDAKTKNTLCNYWTVLLFLYDGTVIAFGAYSETVRKPYPDAGGSGPITVMSGDLDQSQSMTMTRLASNYNMDSPSPSVPTPLDPFALRERATTDMFDVSERAGTSSPVLEIATESVFRTRP
jgi:hypothetical protein